MKIAVRMDDITPGMDWEKFRAFKELLDEGQIKPLIGVVPYNRDENLNRTKENHCREQIGSMLKELGESLDGEDTEQMFWRYIQLLQKEGWWVALHGWQHLYTQKKGGVFPLNQFSEFAGVPYEKQRQMIREGKQKLESYGVQTDMFMAPAHSFDKNTLKALKEEGFDKVTDGFGSSPYVRQGLRFYPISFRLESSLKKKKGTTTLVVHTNTMEEKDLSRYRKIFQEKHIISYGEYLKETAIPRGAFGCGVEYLLACIKRMLVRLM